MIGRAPSPASRSIERRSPARRLVGAPRFVAYLALQVAVFSCPFPWLAAPALAALGLGWSEGRRWSAWLVRSGPLVIAACLPALVGFPWAELVGWLGGAEVLRALLAGWEPSLLRSARLALVLASASWLSEGMSPVELREALVVLLRPLGARAGGRIARAASLTMAFVPWTAAELRRADEAARLRGSDPARSPAGHLGALSVPLVSRVLDKAKKGSEALTLRDPGFGD